MLEWGSENGRREQDDEGCGSVMGWNRLGRDLLKACVGKNVSKSLMAQRKRMTERINLEEYVDSLRALLPECAQCWSGDDANGLIQHT